MFSKSSNRGDPSLELVGIAHIIKEQGIKGEVKALPLSAAARMISVNAEVHILYPSGRREIRVVRSVRDDNHALFISFDGLDRREDAALLRNALIEIDEKALPQLAENEYYHRQIIGLLVVTPEGREVGRVTGIMETGSNDVYIVKGRSREYLIPAIKDVISKIDPCSGTILITPMEGLLD
ncbi:MAG: 16S rRNA processing protein RimM [Nitrospirae bacterium]|nr:16S rRNA processing protein RimM [Nitrospirota bacterium]